MQKLERPKSLAIRVTAQLCELIIDQTIGLGALISENQIAAMLGTSKTPVREAFAQLQTVGLLDVLPQKGGRVFYPDLDQVRELCEVRLLLESDGIRLSMVRDRTKFLKEISAISKQMIDQFDKDAPGPYQKLDAAYHKSFFSHCGNSLLAKAYDLFHPRISALRAHLSVPQAYLLTRSFEEHQSMVKFLQNGETASALAMLVDHIGRTREYHSQALLEVAAQRQAVRPRGDAGRAVRGHGHRS